jgi:hypothetical protein
MASLKESRKADKRSAIRHLYGNAPIPAASKRTI